MTTLLFLLAITILVLGPKKSLELSQTAGEWYRKAQAVKEELTRQLQSEVRSQEFSINARYPEVPANDSEAAYNHPSGTETQASKAA